MAKIRRIITEIITGEAVNPSRIKDSLHRTAIFARVSVEKFMSDEIPLRAASISYSLIVSFVPTLVVILLLGARFIDTEEYFALAREFVRKNGIPLDIAPYIKIIRELLANAGAVSGIGFLVLLFSATSVLRNVEDSLNQIFRVRRARPMLQRISGFILVLVFGPVLLAVGFYNAQNLVDKFASPALNRVSSFDGGAVLVGEKRVFAPHDGSSFVSRPVAAFVDYEFMNRNIVFAEDGTPLDDGRLRELGSKITRVDKNAILNSAFTDAASTGKIWYLLSAQGTLLKSEDKGHLWHITHFQRESDKIIGNYRFYAMLTEGNSIWIVGNRGTIIHSKNSGDTFTLIASGTESGLMDIAKLPDGSLGIVGSEGTALLLKGDSVTEWTAIRKLLPEDMPSFHGLHTADNRVMVAGTSGTVLLSEDGGQSFTDQNLARNLDFRDVLLIPGGQMVAAGENGIIRYSESLPSGDRIWKAAQSPLSAHLNSLFYHAKNKRVYAVGENYSILAADTSGRNGIASFKVVQTAPFWRRAISTTGNVILPFLVVALSFFLIYKIMPYTHVDNKPALIGAAVTSVLWVGFLLAFKIYVKAFSTGTFAIYGTLAAIPLVLLLVYTSAVIMLLGGVIAFLIQNPAMLRLSATDKKREADKLQIWYAFAILKLLVERSSAGKGPAPEKELLKLCNSDQAEFALIAGKLIASGWIARTEHTDYLLAVSPERIMVQEILDALDPADFLIPGFRNTDPYQKNVKGLFARLAQSRKEVAASVSLADLVKI